MTLNRRQCLQRMVLAASGLWLPSVYAQSLSPRDTAFWGIISSQPPRANLSLWLKADGLALANNAAVSSFTDFSGLSRHYVQATGGLQPLFKTLQQNSLPGVVFDGTDDFVSGNTDTGVTAYSLYAVFRMVSTAGTPVPFRFGIDNTFGSNDGYAAIIIAANRSIQHRVLAAPTTMTDGAATTNFELWSIIADATPITALRVNRAGQALTPNNGAFSAPGNVGIIGKFGTFGLPASVILGELLLYKVAHTALQRDPIELYLKNKWGLP